MATVVVSMATVVLIMLHQLDRKSTVQLSDHLLGVSENVVYPIVPNDFADHYTYEKLLFHWEYTQHFQTNPIRYRLTLW